MGQDWRMESRFRYALTGMALPLLAACAQFPELDETQTPGVATAPYPRLLPLEQLLDGPAPTADASMIAGVQGRAEALRGRASGVQAAPVSQDAAVQGRLSRLRQKADALRDADL